MEYFRKNPESGVTSPSQVAIVGDRLFTDVMMANLMGSYGFWIKDGVIERKSFVSPARKSPKSVLLMQNSLPVWRIGCLISYSNVATMHPILKVGLSKVCLLSLF
jgi:hypothetical protein